MNSTTLARSLATTLMYLRSVRTADAISAHELGKAESQLISAIKELPIATRRRVDEAARALSVPIDWLDDTLTRTNFEVSDCSHEELVDAARFLHTLALGMMVTRDSKEAAQFDTATYVRSVVDSVSKLGPMTILADAYAKFYTTPPSAGKPKLTIVRTE